MFAPFQMCYFLFHKAPLQGLAFEDPLPGFKELGKPGHVLLLDGHVFGEHVLEQRWPVHCCQQDLAGQAVRKGIWHTAACQGTLLAGKPIRRQQAHIHCFSCVNPIIARRAAGQLKIKHNILYKLVPKKIFVENLERKSGP